jgi:hypothetical protein
MALVQLSRSLTIAQLEPQKALQYAEKAVTVAAKLKSQPQPSGISPAEWNKWADSTLAGAKSNLAWLKQIEVYRGDPYSLAAQMPAR